MTACIFCLLQVMSELTKNVAFHGSARHMAVLCELFKEAQSTQSVLGELKRLVPAQS